MEERVKHDGTEIFFDALPDAPLAMPRQRLRPPRLVRRFRLMLRLAFI